MLFSNDEQVSAAADLLADGMSGPEVCERLQADFSISQATAYRRLQAARERSDDSVNLDNGNKVAETTLGAIQIVLDRALDSGDDELILQAASAYARAAAVCKVVKR